MRTRSGWVGRGQATVEMALGTLVFVTILLVGIFFAEVGLLAQKVQEAANFAVWEATGRRVHDIENDRWDVYASRARNGAVPSAEDVAQDRYRDFDGRASVDRGGGPTFLALSRATPIEVECSPDPDRFGVLGLGPERASPALASAMRGAEPAAGIACSARSEIRAIRIPESFMEQDGHYKKVHFRANPIPICAVGRADSGVCTGRLAMLLDDWGLQTRADSRECALNIDSGAPRCGNMNGNQSYYNWTQRVYTSFGGRGGAGQALVGLVRGSAPSEGQFFMSFRGVESDFQQNLGSVHGGQTIWETTPFRNRNGVRHPLREENRWLGR